MQLCASVAPLRTESRGAAERASGITSITAPSSWVLKAPAQASLFLQGCPQESHRQPLSLRWTSLLPGFPISNCVPREKLTYFAKQA